MLPEPASIWGKQFWPWRGVSCWSPRDPVCRGDPGFPSALGRRRHGMMLFHCLGIYTGILRFRIRVFVGSGGSEGLEGLYGMKVPVPDGPRLRSLGFFAGEGLGMVFS